MAKNEKIKEIFGETKKYFISRINELCEENRTLDACAMHDELREWLIEQEKPTILTVRRKSRI